MQKEQESSEVQREAIPARNDAVAKDVEPTEDDDSEEDPEWARVGEKPRTGVVLIGRKDWFFADKPSGAVKSALKRVGLAADAAQRIPEDRLAG